IAVNVNAGVGVVRSLASRNANITKPGLTLVGQPAAHTDAVLAETPGFDVFNSDIREGFSAGQAIEHAYSATAVAAPVLSFNDQVADYQSAGVLTNHARAVTGGNCGLTFSVRANDNRCG